MSFLTDPNRIPENYGLRIAAGLIVYFLIMKVAGFSHVVELRLVNIVILIAGVYLALKKFKHTHEEHLNYFRALVTGVATGAIGSVIFALFLFIWMKVDVGMMEHIQTTDPMGRYLNPYIAAFIVALEGVFSGLLVTFILINYVTTDEVSDPIDKKS
jgi:glucan phosphoethanolaminetransferase (alkaline phosphatase superfamily)